MTDVIVIGGGVAGLFASITAARQGKKVIILEKNDSLGKKILVAGNGRCNFTNEYMRPECYESSANTLSSISNRSGANDKIGTDSRSGAADKNGTDLLDSDNKTETSRFIDNILTQFNKDDMLSFMGELGMPYYEREGYYYPLTDEAITMKQALVNEVRRLGIKVIYDYNVRQITKIKEGFEVSDKSKVYSTGSIIMAAGGNAAPKTGSSGDCYYYLEQLGLDIIKPYPALTTLEADYPKELQGVKTLANVELYINDKLIDADYGFIKYFKGHISGIPIYQLSTKAIRALAKGRRVRIKAQLIGDEKSVDELFDKVSKMHNITLREALEQMLNPKMVKAYLGELRIDGNKAIESVDNDEINTLKQLFYGINYDITDYGSFQVAQCTSGGVNISQIEPATMESKVCPGLYLAGEIIDVVGRCGGYNIQFAASTGVVAGRNA